ncbi:MAG TPA: 5'-3' exonuclease H3TH domain-containing protein [Acidimicrobiales bacterium]|nr:5'-3' exonuclease H3TH domain-containing protein [Acidimicrobiales bacterium]
MKVHLVDGTFELFRCFHGAPRATGHDGREVGAARGLVATLVALLHEPAVSHVAVAFDSVVSPRGAGKGAPAEMLIGSQVSLAADVVRALGVPVWPSGRYQADEIIATAAHRFARDSTVDQVVICANDNDFMQCVESDRVVMLDRIRKRIIDEEGVRARFGVAPAQIPDLFALIGDVSDGLPGVPGWGPRSAAAVLNRYGRLDAIPCDPREWDVAVRGKERLSAALRDRWDEARLCRDLAELRTDLPVRPTLDEVEWRGAYRDRCDELARRLDDTSAVDRIERWRG